MRGRMMEAPLLVSSLIEHAGDVYPDQEIVTRTVEGPIHRYTWSDARARARRLGSSLVTQGIREGDRIGTLAWNTHRHLEVYYGVSGMVEYATHSTRGYIPLSWSTSLITRRIAFCL